MGLNSALPGLMTVVLSSVAGLSFVVHDARPSSIGRASISRSLICFLIVVNHLNVNIKKELSCSLSGKSRRANAGYLKQGHATVVTFSDTNGSGSYNRMDLRRYSLDATEDEREYGKTGKPNPYVVTF